jgi:hypothetical protein
VDGGTNEEKEGSKMIYFGTRIAYKIVIECQSKKKNKINDRRKRKEQ